MRIWACSKSFTLASGQLNVEAESLLTEQGIRRTPQPGHYVFTSREEEETLTDAIDESLARLINLMRPYGVTVNVYALEVAAVV